MIIVLGILVFFAINIALTLAFRYWDLHWWIDDATETLLKFLRRVK